MTIQRELFKKGKEALEKGNLVEAEKAFSLSVKKEQWAPSEDYLLYTLLLRSDYKKLSASLGENKPVSGFGLYPLYWFQIMAGALDEADQTIETMLKSNHYFLRAFAVKEQLKKGVLSNLDRNTVINTVLHSSGLSYETPLEEERATLYVNLLQGLYIEAEQISVKMLGQYPANPDVYLDRIDVLTLTGDMNGLSVFVRTETLEKMAENDHRVMIAAARSFYRTGQMEKAKLYLKRLSNYFRNNPLFHYHLANLWLMQKQYVKAIQEYEETIALAPFFERAFYNKGICFYRLGEIVHASDCFKKALAIRKKPDSIFNYSVCMIEKKNLKEAYFFLNRIQQEHSSRPLDTIKDQIKQLAVYT